MLLLRALMDCIQFFSNEKFKIKKGERKGKIKERLVGNVFVGG